MNYLQKQAWLGMLGGLCAHITLKAFLNPIIQLQPSARNRVWDKIKPTYSYCSVKAKSFVLQNASISGLRICRKYQFIDLGRTYSQLLISGSGVPKGSDEGQVPT